MPIAEIASLKKRSQARFCSTENQSLCRVATFVQWPILRSCAKNRQDATLKRPHAHTHTPSDRQAASVPCDQDLFYGHWPKQCLAVLLETGRRVKPRVRMLTRPWSSLRMVVSPSSDSRVLVGNSSHTHTYICVYIYMLTYIYMCVFLHTCVYAYVYTFRC